MAECHLHDLETKMSANPLSTLPCIECTVFLSPEFGNFSLVDVGTLHHEEKKTSVLFCCPLCRHVAKEQVKRMVGYNW